MPLRHELKQEFLKGNLVIFAGAGFVKAYLPAMPSWNELLTSVFASLTGNADEIYNYATEVFDSQGNRLLHPSEYLRLAQQFELEREKVNRERSNQNQELIPSIHEKIHEILADSYDADEAMRAFQNTQFARAQDLPLPIWVTTNYDTFLEDTFLAKGIGGGTDIVVSRPARNIDFGAPSGGGRTLLKIHGSIDNPDPDHSIVITEEDYHRFLRQDRYFINKLYTLFCERFVVFIGYSLADPNIQFIYNEVLFDQKFSPQANSESFAQIRPSFFVSRTPIPNQQKIYYRHKRIQYIENCTPEQFFAELNQAYEEFERGRADVIARIRANIADSLDQIQRVTWDVDPNNLQIAPDDRLEFLEKSFDLVEYHELTSRSTPGMIAIPELQQSNVAVFTHSILRVIRHWGAEFLQMGRSDILDRLLNYVQEKLQVRRSMIIQQLLATIDEWLHQFVQLRDLDRFIRRYCLSLFQYDARYNSWDDYTFCLARFVKITSLFPHMANALRNRVIAGLHRQLCMCGRNVGDSWYTTNAVYSLWPDFDPAAWPLLRRLAMANPNQRHNDAILQYLSPGADFRQFFPR